MQIKSKIQPKKMHVTGVTSKRMYDPVKSTKEELKNDLIRSFRLSWTIYGVEYSTFDNRVRLDSYWASEKDAQSRANQMNKDWSAYQAEVVTIEVQCPN